MGILSIVSLLVAIYPFQGVVASTTQVRAEDSAKAMVVPICGEPSRQVRRIGWGKVGLQFDVPKREIRVLGGKPDVDYVRYVIKPKAGQGYLQLWFGPYAFNSNPEKELLENSVSTRKRDIVTVSGEQMGTDSSGKLRTGEDWRHTFFMIQGLEGAKYKASPDNAPLFDGIIDSACYIPYSKN